MAIGPEMNHYLRLVEYESDDGTRTASVERTPRIGGWLVILQETTAHGQLYFREEHEDLATARKACRYYVMKLRQAGVYRKGVRGGKGVGQ